MNTISNFASSAPSCAAVPLLQLPIFNHDPLAATFPDGLMKADDLLIRAPKTRASFS